MKIKNLLSRGQIKKMKFRKNKPENSNSKENQTDTPYTVEFYKRGAEISYTTAQIAINVFKHYYMPESVVDVGCSVGSWLKAWQDTGVKDVKGFDVHNLDDSYLYIPRKNISVVDLEKYDFPECKKYDLAMSLEVAEHLHEKHAAKFVHNLTGLSDVVIFSAATPFQGGTHHVNEQPPQYWVDLFNKQGFECFDFLRNELMRNPDSTSWHAQNILVFVSRNKSEIFLKQGLKIDNAPIFFYHPRTYMDRVEEIERLRNN